MSVEKILACAGVVLLGSAGGADFRAYNRQKASALPVLDDLIHQYALPGGLEQRDRKISVVIGTSGAGKTFFALKYLPGFRSPKGMGTVGLYLHAADTGAFCAGDVAINMAADIRAMNMAADIRSKLSQVDALRQAPPLPAKLNMHVCVILDEAGNSDLQGWFEHKENLTLLHEQIQKNLAESVMLVVAGTGVTGTYLDSQSDAYKFRMRPWGSADVVKYLLREGEDQLDLNGRETVQEVVDAIFDQPKLRALVTNARSTHYMIEAIRFLSAKYARDCWALHLDRIAVAVVTRVMHQYMTRTV
jgi:hypothetical protein